ncbi:MAG: protein kinase [Acidobacteria bacterium]|nr:protein kinase [Acidobacteriota bacterium]
MSQMLAPETILQDRYRILRQLGQGGMGAVYEAVDQRLDTTVALKETLFVEEKLRKQFEREARLLARLHHPALPRVSDHFAEAEGAFLVMQYIAGDDLAEMIARRRGSFPLEQVLLWADQLLDALDYLHTQDPQIIHRDIKPQNLKLSSRGQIILLDFGLAKGQLGDVSRVTTSASIFGYTPNYAPLEQVQGLGTDPRSDIYALAATLYHLLTGTKPPDALTRAAALVNGQPDPLQLAAEVNPAVGPQVSAVLQRAMAQNREQRYPTAAAMRNALQSSNETTVSGREEAATVLFPSATSASANTNLGVANPTVPVSGAHSGETTVVKAAPAVPRKRTAPWTIAAGVLLLGLIGAGVFYAFERGKNATTITPAATPTPAQVFSASVGDPSPSGGGQNSVGAHPSTSEKAKNAPAATESKKKPDNSKQEAAREEADRQKQKEEERRTAEDAEREAQAAKQKEKDKRSAEASDVPDVPGYIEVPGPNGRGRRRIPTVTNKTLPDGTRIMVTPNGTRIVTMPDGSTRVFPPGQRGGPRQRRRERP